MQRAVERALKLAGQKGSTSFIFVPGSILAIPVRHESRKKILFFSCKNNSVFSFENAVFFLTLRTTGTIPIPVILFFAFDAFSSNEATEKGWWGFGLVQKSA
jgi:hypothetical protein